MSESISDETVATDDADEERLDRADLLALVETLQSENARLRKAYRDAQRQRYRRTAVGFAAIGVVSLVGAALFPGVRTVLVALGGTGLFAAVMTLYLTPESFVPATVGEAISHTYSENAAAIVTDLGLSERRVYLPTETGSRLYLPQYQEFEAPEQESLATPFVTGSSERSRGLSLIPVGEALYEQFEQTHSGPVPERPGPLSRALADAIVEQFELADAVDPDAETGRVALGVAGARINPTTALDHPLVSLVAVGLVSELDTAVDVTVEEPTDERYDTLIVYTWDERSVDPSE